MAGAPTAASAATIQKNLEGLHSTYGLLSGATRSLLRTGLLVTRVYQVCLVCFVDGILWVGYS
jgi:hypothetical protein